MDLHAPAITCSKAILIREFSLDLLDQVLQIQERATSDKALNASRLRALHERAPDTFLVALIDDRVVAYIAAFMTGESGYVRLLATHPDYRRQRLGAMLLHAIGERLWTKGATSVTSHLETSNIAAVTLYKKLGFTVQHTVFDYFPDRAPAYYVHHALKAPAQPIPDLPHSGVPPGQEIAAQR